MPERDAITASLGDGFVLIAAGVRRQKDGALPPDLMLQNGRLLYAAPAVLNCPEATWQWATRATATDRPIAERLAEEITEYLLPDALKVLQEEPKKSTQADELVRLVLAAGDFAADAANGVEMCHIPDQQSYATITVGDHRENWPVRSRGFRLWLSRKFFEKRAKTPGSQALIDAASVLEGKALFEGPEYPIFTRVAVVDRTVYLDLAADDWRAVEIDAVGWRLVTDPPVKFRRARGMLALPVPVGEERWPICASSSTSAPMTTGDSWWDGS